jgi:pyruvate formate lyase activating enzyme
MRRGGLQRRHGARAPEGSAMTALHEASFYERLPDHEVRCTLCPHDCHVRAGGRGACGVRFNVRGALYTLVYDRVVSRGVDPIEKKPLFHFLPGSRAYSIATVGCNLRCSFCQNWTVSQWPKDHLPRTVDGHGGREPTELVCPQLAAAAHAVMGEEVTPDEIVERAIASGCRSIAYTYTEPTVFYELAHDTAVRARARGLKNVFVTNGFTSEAPLREIAKVLDAVNVDLKFFAPESYRRISRARLEPILDAIRLYRALGVWVEVTTLVIPGVNDSDGELRGIAEFVRSVGPEVPWHVSQFYPAYKMLDLPATPLGTLHRAARIGRAAGLRHVYEGNVPGSDGELTRCHLCNTLLVERYGFHVLRNGIVNGCCPACGTRVDGVEMSPAHAPHA